MFNTIKNYKNYIYIIITDYIKNNHINIIGYIWGGSCIIYTVATCI